MTDLSWNKKIVFGRSNFTHINIILGNTKLRVRCLWVPIPFVFYKTSSHLSSFGKFSVLSLKISLETLKNSFVKTIVVYLISVM